MRIQGGKFHNKPIGVPQDQYVRPAGARMREALMNILHGWGAVDGAVVLDAFAGSGILGLEALSHGARRASFLELDGAVLRQAEANATSLGLDGSTTPAAHFLRADASHPPPAKKGAAADLAFIDPPYGSGLAERALPALAEAGWLAVGANIVVHVAAKEDFDAPDGFALEQERRYGKAKVYLLVYTAGEDDAPELG